MEERMFVKEDPVKGRAEMEDTFKRNGSRTRGVTEVRKAIVGYDVG
jgi:hypothetical protein